MTTTAPAPTRTEVEAVADALVSLLTARLVPAERAMEACRAMGIAAHDLNDARIRAELGRTRKPRPAEMWPTLSGPGDFEPVSERVFRGTNGSSHDGMVPRPASTSAPTVVPVVGTSAPSALTYKPSLGVPLAADEKLCRGCTMWRPVEDFPPTGRRCRECVNRTRRERYLSVERADQIERATLRYVVAGGDPHWACAQCGDPLREGEDVAAVAVHVIHARHLEGVE